MGIFSDAIEVQTTSAGLPLRLLWQGRRYTLGAEPVRWYERRNWWEEERRAPPGSAEVLVDYEVWRVQVRRDDRPEQDLVTFELVRYRPSGRWRVLKIDGALAERAAPARTAPPRHAAPPTDDTWPGESVDDA